MMNEPYSFLTGLSYDFCLHRFSMWPRFFLLCGNSLCSRYIQFMYLSCIHYYYMKPCFKCNRCAVSMCTDQVPHILQSLESIFGTYYILCFKMFIRLYKILSFYPWVPFGFFVCLFVLLFLFWVFFSSWKKNFILYRRIEFNPFSSTLPFVNIIGI